MVNRIRELLDARQLSPTQFADLIGVGRPVMSHILSERNKPSLEVVQKILDAFPDVSLAWLMKGTGSMQAAAAVTPVATPAAVPAPVSPPPISPVRNELAMNTAAVPPSAPAPTAAPTVAVSSQPQAFTLSPATSAPVVKRASPVPRPIPSRFQPGRAQASVAAAVPASPLAAAEPAVAAPVVAPTLPPPASPTPVASTAVAPAFEALSSLTLPPAPVASTSLSSTNVAPGYPPAAAPAAPAMVNQATSVAPAPAVASAPPATVWAPPAAEAEAPIKEVPAATPNPAAALSFLGEPGKAIRRIVIFYRDGSFSDYVPEGY